MKRKNFTLVELLIVIAIIVILAAMLLPVLDKARNRAKGIYCIGNLKQSGLTAVLYGNDNNGWAPIPYDTGRSLTWTGILNQAGYIQSTKRNFLVCPTARPFEFIGFNNTYGMWAYEYSSRVRLWGAYQGTGGIPYIKEGPARQIVMADSLAAASLTSAQTYHIYGWVNSQRYFDLRHQRQLNAFFADGHSSSVNASATGKLGIKYYLMEGRVCSN
ncbi:MAG: hypothetical protein BWY31_02301 [Lentisphaerae bacterium ADurb.Bin242]|nr:MAG: hypothetical protein BWY31_02301 [Lentisphaerae bacterium ADurb.Bin242]